MKTVAIIGCGKPPENKPGHKVGWGVGYAHANGYKIAFPDVKLLAVDPNAENLAAFGDKFSIPNDCRFSSADTLYATQIPDAVSVCTWPALHVPMALEAIRKGVKAITVEKPLGLDGFQIQELIDTAKHRGARVAVAHQRRYEPWYAKAKEIIEQGTLGEKLVIEARVGDDWDILSWTTHWFDMANYLFDRAPVSVLAGVDHQGQRRYGHAVENASVIMADYGATRQAVFITGPAAIPLFGVAICGEKGMLHIGNPILLWSKQGYSEIPVDKVDFQSAFGLLFADLWRSIDGPPSRCDISNCAPATLMAYAAHESARTDRRVSLPLSTWFAPLEVMQNPSVPPTTPALNVAVVADPHHVWAGFEMSGREGLVDAVSKLGHRVKLIDATKELSPDALSGMDLLVLYHTQRKTSPSHRAVIGQWFEQSKPVVVSHCGIGAYADWPEYRRWIGRYWVWGGENLPPSGHPHVPCKVFVDDPARFAVDWREAYLPTDEMYQGLAEASPTRTLATALDVHGSKQIYAWQVIDHPNVVAWLPGHRRDMFAISTVVDGLRAAIRLATGR